MKDLQKIAALGTMLSKKYARKMFRLLKDYQSISASEASSRLNLHIQTVQEFLETTYLIGLTDKTEVVEGKRPYFRYTLEKQKLNITFDLSEFFDREEEDTPVNKPLIRENKNSKSHFSVARGGNYFSSVSVLSGSGRDSKQRKINLTNTQGKFLFHLPFPDAAPQTVEEIMHKAGISEEYHSEIDNLIDELIKLRIIQQVELNTDYQEKTA